MKSLATQNFPTREDFKQRFNKKLRGLSNLFAPVTEQLAEEAESLILENWLQNKGRHIVEITYKSHCSSRRHYCPNCHKDF